MRTIIKIREDKMDYVIYREGSGKTIEIFDIAVYSHRGVGRGTALFQELLKETRAKRVFAITRTENKEAQHFYEKNGFIGHDLPRFYSDGDAKIYIYERNK